MRGRPPARGLSAPNLPARGERPAMSWRGLGPCGPARLTRPHKAVTLSFLPRTSSCSGKQVINWLLGRLDCSAIEYLGEWDYVDYGAFSSSCAAFRKALVARLRGNGAVILGACRLFNPAGMKYIGRQPCPARDNQSFVKPSTLQGNSVMRRFGGQPLTSGKTSAPSKFPPVETGFNNLVTRLWRGFFACTRPSR